VVFGTEAVEDVDRQKVAPLKTKGIHRSAAEIPREIIARCNVEAVRDFVSGAGASGASRINSNSQSGNPIF
jgi:hypothetical protein